MLGGLPRVRADGVDLVGLEGEVSEGLEIEQQTLGNCSDVIEVQVSEQNIGKTGH